MKDKDGKFSNGIIERFNRTFVASIKNYKTVHPVKGINQLAEELPNFIDDYHDCYHRTIGCTPNEAWDNNMVVKNRDRLNDTQINKVNFKVGNVVRVKKERTIFTKGRTE